jgi:hypothetical protein
VIDKHHQAAVQARKRFHGPSSRCFGCGPHHHQIDRP